jgi:cytosine/adenosine deaminase-related metal-dependent hydrolase
VADHVTAILENITLSGSLILVHNTSITRQHIDSLKARKNLWYCLCPDSNLYISRKLPPLQMMIEMGCDMVLGTDSLSSNSQLSMLAEMITLQQNFPDIGLESIVKWATINGAKALGEDGWAGSITPGKRPGLVLISDCDLTSQKLLPASNARRII